MEAVLDKFIERTPEVRSGRARIAGTRITVDDIVVMYAHLGQPVEEIVAKHGLPPAAVHAALAYYYDRKAEVDQLIVSDDAIVEAFKKNNPSKLQEKLRALGRA